jgi:hypothetical protein
MVEVATMPQEEGVLQEEEEAEAEVAHLQVWQVSQVHKTFISQATAFLTITSGVCHST